MRVVSKPKHESIRGPYDRVFAEMAETRPGQLMQLLRDDKMDPWMASFAAEAVSQARSPEALTLAVELTSHREGLIREGAALGLAEHRERRHVRAALRRMMEHDERPALRILAEDILEDRLDEEAEEDDA